MANSHELRCTFCCYSREIDQVYPRHCLTCGKPEIVKAVAPPPVASLVSPWVPMSNPISVKHLGKLAEEASELGAATARCLIQGIDESEPVTGKPNREWLEDEIADVLANAELVMAYFKLDLDRIYNRSDKKKVNLRLWHSMATGEETVDPSKFAVVVSPHTPLEVVSSLFPGWTVIHQFAATMGRRFDRIVVAGRPPEDEREMFRYCYWVDTSLRTRASGPGVKIEFLCG